MPNPSKDVRDSISHLTLPVRLKRIRNVKLWNKIASYITQNKTKEHTSNKSIGQKSETIAINFLKQKGFQFIERNYRSSFGEIDIIMRDKTELVFVEVKSRNETGLDYGLPEEAVNLKKQHQIRRLAKGYLNQHRQVAFTDYRMDIVSIILDQQGKAISVTHLPDAF